MLLLIHNLLRVSQVDSFNHHAGDGAFFNREKLQEVRLVDLRDELTDFDVAVEVLPTAAASQVHELVTVVSTFTAQTLLDLHNVLFLEEPGGCVLEFPHAQNNLLCLWTAHAYLWPRSTQSRCGPQATPRRHAHLFTLGCLLLADRDLKLVLGDPDTILAEAVVDRVVFHNGAIQSEQIESPSRVGVL